LSVLYDPEDEFLVEQKPHAIAIDHIRQQIDGVENDASAAGIVVALRRTRFVQPLRPDFPEPGTPAAHREWVLGTFG